MKINYYKKDGELDSTIELNNENLKGINGMLVKCYLKNGEIEVGYGDPFKVEEASSDLEISDYIYLWTWKNLDETTNSLIGDDESKYEHSFQKIYIADIKDIDAILHSNPRWGGKLTNKFEFSKKHSNTVDLDIPDFLKERL